MKNAYTPNIDWKHIVDANFDFCQEHKFSINCQVHEFALCDDSDQEFQQFSDKCLCQQW